MSEEIIVEPESEIIVDDGSNNLEVSLSIDADAKLIIENQIEATAEISEWIITSDNIVIRKYEEIPQWLNDIINDAVDWDPMNDRLDDMQNLIDLLGSGYNNLVAITDDQSIKLEYLAAEQDGMAASIKELQITKITKDEAIAISQETIGSWLESGDAASWFDRMIATNASLTSANAAAIANLHSELDGITSDIDEIMKTTVTKIQNPMWIDDCNYIDNPDCEPSDPDQYGNPRWIYNSEAQYQLLVDANGNVAGLDIFACDSTDPTVNCETVFSIFANKFVVKANPSQAIATSPFVINTNTSPTTVAFNGEVHFLNPADGSSAPLYDYLNDLNTLIEQNKQLIQDNMDMISDIAGDDLITANEKKDLQIQLSKINSDLTALRGQFFIFGVDNPDATYPPQDPPPSDIENQKLFDYQLEVASINELLTNVVEIDNGQDVYLSTLTWEGNPLNATIFVDEFYMHYSKQQVALEELMRVADDYYQGQFNIIDNEIVQIDTRLTQAEQDILDLESKTSMIADDGWVVIKEKKELRIIHNDLLTMRNHIENRYAVYGITPGNNALLDDVIAKWDILDPYLSDTDQLDIFAADDVIDDTELVSIGSSRDDFNAKFNDMYSAINAVIDDIDSIIEGDLSNLTNRIDSAEQDISDLQSETNKLADDGWILIKEKQDLKIIHTDLNEKQIQIQAQYAIYGITPGSGNATLDEVVDAWAVLDPYLITDLGINDDPLADTELTAIGSSRDDFNAKFNRMYDALNAVLSDLETILDSDIGDRLGTIDGKVELLKTLSVFGQEQAKETYGDGIVDVDEKIYFIGYKSVLLKEYQLAVFGYSVYGVNPGDDPAAVPPYVNPHQIALNDLQTRYDELIDYLENTLLVDDTSTDTPIPDEQTYIDTFTNYYAARDTCYQMMTSIPYDDIGSPDGGTIIDGGHITTQTIDADCIRANTIMSAPIIYGGAVVGSIVYGSEIRGVQITGSIIKSSWIDYTSTGDLTNWKYFGPPGNPDGLPEVPSEYESNFAHNNTDGSLLVDDEGYCRLQGFSNAGNRFQERILEIGNLPGNDLDTFDPEKTLFEYDSYTQSNTNRFISKDPNVMIQNDQTIVKAFADYDNKNNVTKFKVKTSIIEVKVNTSFLPLVHRELNTWYYILKVNDTVIFEDSSPYGEENHFYDEFYVDGLKLSFEHIQTLTTPGTCEIRVLSQNIVIENFDGMLFYDFELSSDETPYSIKTNASHPYYSTQINGY